MSDTTHSDGPPTVVLVHGAFADGSSWNSVIERLQEKGVPVVAPANPLRGLSIDSTYIAGVLEQTPGRIIAVVPDRVVARQLPAAVIDIWNAGVMQTHDFPLVVEERGAGGA